MNLRPLNDRLLVRRLRTGPSSAIVVPDCAQQPSLIGEVVAVGPGKRRKNGSRQPLDVKPGQLVAFGKYTDFEDEQIVKIFDGQEVVMIQEADIRGIVEHGTSYSEETNWID